MTGLPGSAREPATDEDRSVVAAQLGRSPRGTRAVAHRCPCGLPDVVETTPRLSDGTPFPTLFYLTCPKATAACSRLESAGVMKEMSARLATDPDLAAAYLAAHEDYLARRTAIMEVDEIDGVSAGGMPGRVKCLHVHLGHLARGRAGSEPVRRRDGRDGRCLVERRSVRRRLTPPPVAERRRQAGSARRRCR